MLSERELRILARRALDAGTVPNRPPDRTWDGPGIGAACTVCQVPISGIEVEYELQYKPDERTPTNGKFRAHLRCAAILELVRGQPALVHAGGQADESLKATAVTVSSSISRPSAERRPFTLSGPITLWNPGTRELSILDRSVQLAPHVSQLGVELGVRIVVAGYHDPPTGQMVVTRLLLES